MKKKSQIAIIIVFGLLLLLFFGVYFYVDKLSTKSKTGISATKALESSDSDVVKNYAEGCLKRAAEEALFKRIGLYGGYTNPDGDEKYGEEGLGDKPSALFLDDKVPYYIEKVNTNGATYKRFMPTLDKMSRKLANYIAVEFENCFKAKVFENIGLRVIKPAYDYKAINFDFSKTNVDIYVGVNEEDVSVQFKYPLVIRKGDRETKLDTFSIKLPIRLKALYDSAIALLNNAIETNAIYDISLDCTEYDKNGLTNVYIKNSDDNSAKIVQFVDFSTYYNYYLNSYTFQFAIKDIGISGSCTI